MMDNIIIKETLDFMIPNEMRDMTAEEHAKYFPCNNEENYGIRNEEKHTVIAITFKKRPLFVGRAASVDACLKVTEKKIKKNIPSYENTGYGERTVDGKKLKTFSFKYTLQGNNLLAEYDLYLSNKYFCAFEFFCNDEHRTFAEQKFREFMDSIKFKNSH